MLTTKNIEIDRLTIELNNYLVKENTGHLCFQNSQ